MDTYRTLAEEAVHKFGLDPNRVILAVDIAASHGMIYNKNCNPGEFDVRSRNGRGWYHVNTRTKSCTCPDSQLGHNICKHRVAVWLYTQAIVRPHAEARRVEQAIIMQELGYA